MKPNTAQPQTAAIDGMAVACRALALWVLAAVMCLIALPGYAEQVPIYDAPYEVIEGYPSCNGPDQRLVRIKLRVPDVLEHAYERHPQCEIRQRHGNKTRMIAIPCKDTSRGAKKSATDGADKSGLADLSMETVVEICQSPLAYKADIKAGAINYQSDLGTTKVFPILAAPLGAMSISDHLTNSEPSAVLLVINCHQLTELMPGTNLYAEQYVAYFAPRSQRISDCTDDTCFAAKRRERPRQPTRFYTICGAPQSGASE